VPKARNSAADKNSQGVVVFVDRTTFPLVKMVRSRETLITPYNCKAFKKAAPLNKQDSLSNIRFGKTSPR
jgi:hypothetical protein